MVKEVYPNIYLNEIPLPNNPLKAINSYIIPSKERSVIIDSGFNLKECKEAFMQGVLELDIDLNRTDLLLTHMHHDHSGLADDMKENGATIYIGKQDGEIINQNRTSSGLKFRKMNKILSLEQQESLFDVNAGFGKPVTQSLTFSPLVEGNTIDVAEYRFEVVDIPGHTPGHIGFYERENKLFFCGDHILDEVTPNITFWGFEQDILNVYFKSLKKIYNYEIDYLFTAHRNIIRDHKNRIDRLLKHHQERLEEITEIIREGWKTPNETAAQMHWELSYKEWEEFPSPQKWFASGEALAHLEHLVYQGIAETYNHNGSWFYKLIG